MTRVSLSRALRHGASALTVGLLAAPLLATAAQADTLKVAATNLPTAFGNPFTGRGIPHVFTWGAIFNYPTFVNKEGGLDPQLFASWTNKDPLTWEFKIQPGVTFSNGEKFDAAAAKATFDWLLGDPGKASIVGKDVSGMVAEAIVTDAMTLTIKSVKPAPILPRQLVSVAMVAPKAWKDMGVEEFAKKPSGTGSYRITEFKAGEALAEAHPNSWRKVTGDFDKLQIIAMPEGAARVSALQSGQVHIDVATNIDAIDGLKKAGFMIDTVPGPRTLGITLVSTKKATPDPAAKSEPVKGPLADKRVRQALNYAVNKDSIVENIYRGQAKAVSQTATSTAFGFNPNLKPYEYNPTKAKQLLAEAGYPNGFPMEIRASQGNATFDLVYQSAVQDLEKVGIKAKFVSQPFPEWLKYWTGGDWPYEGFGFGTDLTGILDAGRGFEFTSCFKKPPYYCNEDEMKLFDAAQVEFDPAKREKLLQDLLAVNRDNAPIIYLVEGTESMAYDPKITGFKQTNLVVNYHELKLKK